jgi:ligand-binding SRPBCC domain-containing protein
LHHFQSSQKLPISLEKAWDFFSDPQNLKVITPPEMGFVVHKDFDGRKTYSGQIINYTVRPIFGIPLNWTTEITHVNAPHFFVDEQRFGPYAFWHHKHHFSEIDGGVLMEDSVHYIVPLGIFGQIANALFIKRQLNQIFDFRTKKLRTIFGEFVKM